MKIPGFILNNKGKFIAGLFAAVLIGGFLITRSGASNVNIQTDVVKKDDVKLTVLTTGQVVSGTNLNLSFKASGVLQSLKVKEGDQVKAGQVLATLSQADQAAVLTQSRGALASANANYQKVLAGVSTEELAVAQAGVNAAQVALDNAKNQVAVSSSQSVYNNAKQNFENVKLQQEQVVKNAFLAMMNSTLEAIPAASNISNTTLTVSGAYTGTTETTVRISVALAGNGFYYNVAGLNNSPSEIISRGIPLPIGDGLSITFSQTGTLYGVESWTINIPNKNALNYLANANAYQSALQNQIQALHQAQDQVDAAQNSLNSAGNSTQSSVAVAQSSLEQAVAAFNLKKAFARPADIALAKAQILSAQGQVQAAQAAIENTIIRAPLDGTITVVDIKVGELATAQKEVIVLQDVKVLHVEANVSEANIAELKTDQSVDVTFDALGPNRHFVGKVESINPGATVVSGVVNYKVVVGLQDLTDIKPGMTSNITILVEQKSGVLIVPQRAVLSHDNKQFVRVIDDPVKKTFHEVEVKTGLKADGGVVEIVSGLSENQPIVTFIPAS